MKKHIGTVIIGLIILFILILYSIAFSVRWKEKALVLTFGKIKRVESEPGLKWAWPWESVVKFDGRIRTYQTQARQIQTRDKQTIIVTVYANWRIEEPKVFYERFRTATATSGEDVVVMAEKTLGGWISDALTVFAEYNLGQLITLDDSKLKAVEIGEEQNPRGMLQRIQAKAATGKGYGIEIIDLGLKKLGVPDAVSKSVFDRMKQERLAVISTLMSEGKSQADSIVGSAEGQATIIIADAEAEAKRIEGEGDAQAAQFYARFLANPEFANFLRRLDTLRDTLNDRTTIILDNKSVPFNLVQSGPNVEKMVSSSQDAAPEQ